MSPPKKVPDGTKTKGPTGIVQVAGLAHVTPSVVSRLLNNDPLLRIRPATESRIRAAVRQLDYHPNASARALRTLHSGAIGLAVYDVTNPMFADIVAGATASANEAGYVVLLADATALATDLEASKSLIHSSRLEGILFQGGGLPNDIAFVERTKKRMPVVLLNWSMGAGIPAVLPNDEMGVQMAIDYLVSLGHRRIAHITGFPGTHPAGRRQQAFERAIATVGLTSIPEWTVPASWDVANGRLAMKRLLSVSEQPSAVFVDNVISALGALREAIDSGVGVPQELSIIALHDSWVAELVSPQLTTVKLPLYEMGWDGVKLLLEPPTDQARESHVVLRPAPLLMARSSTAAPSMKASV